jgi:hypothetical protein
MTTTSRPVSTEPATVPTRRNRWVAGFSVILVLVGLAVGFLVGRATKPDVVLPSDLADTTVTTMLNDYLTAVNEGDETEIASFFATDATFTDTAKRDGYVMEGNTQIAKAMASWHPLGFQMWAPGTAIHNDDYVAQYTVSSVGPAIAVYELQDGKIQNVWIARP